MSLQEWEFLANGGDPSWLKGVKYTPKKMQSLLELNAILAHQPWLANKDNIAVRLPLSLSLMHDVYLIMCVHVNRNW